MDSIMLGGDRACRGRHARSLTHNEMLALPYEPHKCAGLFVSGTSRLFKFGLSDLGGRIRHLNIRPWFDRWLATYIISFKVGLTVLI